MSGTFSLLTYKGVPARVWTTVHSLITLVLLVFWYLPNHAKLGYLTIKAKRITWWTFKYLNCCLKEQPNTASLEHRLFLKHGLINTILPMPLIFIDIMSLEEIERKEGGLIYVKNIPEWVNAFYNMRIELSDLNITPRKLIRNWLRDTKTQF